MSVDVFISYAPEDKVYLQELESHLKLMQRHRILQGWHAELVLAGQDWGTEVEQRLMSARVILLLLSAEYISSDVSYAQMERAIQRARQGEACVIPVLVRPYSLTGSVVSALFHLPDNGVPVTKWPNRDAAWENVASGIRSAIVDLDRGKTVSPMTSYPSASQPLESAHSPNNWPTTTPHHVPVAPLSSSNSIPATETFAGGVAPAPSRHIRTDDVVKHSAWWRWPLVASACALVAVIAFMILSGRVTNADSSATPSAAANICCGGVDCPKEQQQPEGTSCEKGDFCRPCKSGRTRVTGPCAGFIPPTNTYRLRLAGVTIPGYVPDMTDTICVRRTGASPVCATVYDAMARPLLGQTRMTDLTAEPGLDVWFERDKTRMRNLQGMRIQRTMTRFMNSALCIGAVLYSTDGSEIVRFFLEEL